MIPIFDEHEIRAVIDAGAAVETIRAAFRADGQGRTTVPAVINLVLPRVHGEFHVKTAHIEGVPYVAVKIASGFYENAPKGLPSGSGMVALFDAATGLPAGLLFDNGFLTDLRTGAAGAVAAEYVARPILETVGVIGSGVQARFQVECLRVVRSFNRLVAWSPSAERLERYCREVSSRFTLDVRAAESPEAVCRDADLLITATPAREPFVRAEWLRPGSHVTAVGSDAPGKRELYPDCLRLADLVVVDRRSQSVMFGEGSAAPHRIMVELGELVAGKKSGRSSDSDITIADLTGVGFQDTAIASEVFKRLSQRTH